MIERTNKSNILNGTIWNFIGTLIRLGFGIIGSIIFVRYLGVQQYGVAVYISDLALFSVVIASLGLGTLQARLVPVLIGNGEIDKYKYLLIHNVKVRILFLSVILTLATVLKEFKFFGIFDQVDGFFIFYLIFSLLQISIAVYKGPLNLDYQQKFINIVETGSLAFRIAAVIPVIYFDWGLIGFLCTEIIAELGQLSVLAIKFHWSIGKAMRGKIPKKYEGKILSESLFLFAIDFSSRIFGKEFDIILLSNLCSEGGFANIAIYSICFVLVLKAFSFLGLGSSNTATLLMSYSADLMSSGKGAKISLMIEKQLKLLIVAVVPLTVNGIVLGGSIIRFMYGDSFSGGEAIVSWIFFGFSVSSIAYITKPLLFVLKKEGKLIWFRGIWAVAKIAVCAFVIPRYGIQGMSIVAALFLGGISVAELIILRKYVQISCPSVFILKIAMSASSMVGSIYLISSFIPLQSVLGLIVAGIGGTVGYAINLLIIKPFDMSDYYLIKGYRYSKFDFGKVVKVFSSAK